MKSISIATSCVAALRRVRWQMDCAPGAREAAPAAASPAPGTKTSARWQPFPNHRRTDRVPEQRRLGRYRRGAEEVGDPEQSCDRLTMEIKQGQRNQTGTAAYFAEKSNRDKKSNRDRNQTGTAAYFAEKSKKSNRDKEIKQGQPPILLILLPEIKQGQPPILLIVLPGQPGFGSCHSRWFMLLLIHSALRYGRASFKIVNSGLSLSNSFALFNWFVPV
jgi:hypothetical protein